MIGRPATVRSSPILWISLLIGALPVLAGLTFRTYWFFVEPAWLESLRQFDFPFFPAELAAIFIARERGMTLTGCFALLDRPARAAAAAFLATFWLGSAFLSEQPLYSLLRCLFVVTHIGFGFAVFHLVRGSLARNVATLAALMSVGLLVYLPLLATHFALAPEPQAMPGGAIVWSSALPGFLSVRHLGIHAGAILALTAAIAILPRFAAWRPWALAAVLLSATLLFWSGTRSGVYGFAGAGVLTAVMLRRALPLAPSLRVALCMAAALPLSLLFLPPDPNFGVFNRLTADAAAFGAGRWELWGRHWPLFVSSPWFGHGEGATFWLAIIGDMHHVQPHNAIIQLVVAWGLIPCLPFAYLATRCWSFLHRQASLRPAAAPLVMMVDCLLIMSLVDGVLYFTRMTMLVAAGVAIVCASRRDSPAVP